MSKLINFFFSFDKLLKEGLVRAAFWLGLLNIALLFMAEMLGAIRLDWFAAVFEFIFFFARFLFYIVALRIIAELAIAIFRMNDNISPDGGKSETADIDPVAEARKAAELAARRAQEATKSAVDKTSAATKSAAERGKSTGTKLSSSAQSGKPQVKPVSKNVPPAKAQSKAAASRPSTAKKSTAKKSTAAKPSKKPAPKAATAKTKTAKPRTKATAKPKSKTALKRKPGYKLDGTPRKKSGPKAKT